MIEIGFKDIAVKEVLVPINGWPRDPADQELGKWYNLNSLRFTGSLDKLLEKAGIAEDKIPEYKEQVRWDLTSDKMRVYVPGKVLPEISLSYRTYLIPFTVFAVYGRKPTAHENSNATEAT